MSAPSRFASIELEIGRIREFSRSGLHSDALAAAEALAGSAPENRDVLYLIAANQRCLNRVPEALATLARLERHHPRFSLLYQERGHCYANERDPPRAIEAFRQAVSLNPALIASWTMLERLYRSAGEFASAAAARARVAALHTLPPEVLRAGSLFSDDDLAAAEYILRRYLSDTGPHVEAVRLLARIEHQRGALEKAERLFEDTLRLAPDYQAARFDYARVLVEGQKYQLALQQLDSLRTLEPDNRDYLLHSAAAHAGLGQHDEAIALYRQLLAAAPASAELYVLQGHSLQASGRRKEAIASYRAAAAARPGFGDAYWSLANLKTYRFPQDEIAHMRAAEAAPGVPPADRYHLCFALGKAYEDHNEFSESWEYYQRGNQLKNAECRYDRATVETDARRQIEFCTVEFFAARNGAGAPERDPIFIVGLPRSGSTLIEQILASHSQIDGTRELHDLPRIVAGIERPGSDCPRYPDLLTGLSREDFRRLGERYIAGAAPFRKGKPFFVDKMPNNFRHVGLIHLILPNARIVDVRREPMACCFGNLKQLFAAGQEFTYGIENVARYYRVYLELMRHWDAVLPGRVLRVHYEDVVENLETNVRRLLEFCGLDFEPACLEFYKTQRSVSTASSEQVRQPVYREGLVQWKNYERWLGPLCDALGDALIRYRESV